MTVKGCFVLCYELLSRLSVQEARLHWDCSFGGGEKHAECYLLGGVH